jgi:hypothetical protein
MSEVRGQKHSAWVDELCVSGPGKKKVQGDAGWVFASLALPVNGHQMGSLGTEKVHQIDEDFVQRREQFLNLIVCWFAANFR